MTKKEFLQTLQSQLQGELSQAQIAGHIHYYDEYISEAMASGKAEEEILDELGSPVFIAKTLMDTAEISGNQDFGGYDQNVYGEESENDDAYNDDYFHGKMHTWNVSPFVAKWVVPIVLVCLLLLVLSLLGTIAMFVARFFVPIMLVVLVIAIFKSYSGR